MLAAVYARYCQLPEVLDALWACSYRETSSASTCKVMNVLLLTTVVQDSRADDRNLFGREKCMRSQSHVRTPLVSN